MTPVCAFDFVDLRLVDVDVRDIPRPRRESVGAAAGDPVIEPGAYGNQEVAVFDRIVRTGSAVHAQHAKPQFMFRG